MKDTRAIAVRLLAAALLASHLVVAALAVSPALHHWLHGDSDESDHHCAVTAMIDGQFDRPATQCLAVNRQLVVLEIRDLRPPAQTLPSFFRASPGERAPPKA